MARASKAKFRVGQVVASSLIKPTEYFVITKIQNIGMMDKSYPYEWHYFTPTTKWWAEFGLRPLTARERGPAKGATK